MDRSRSRLLEDNAFLKEILLDEDALDSDSADDNLELEDPHAVDVLAAKRDREVAKDPNYVPSLEV